MPDPYRNNGVPKDGKLYWLKPTAEEIRDGLIGTHLFRYWDAEINRFVYLMEPAGMVALTSESQKIPEIPPRHDGTILQERTPYEGIDIE